MDNKTIITVLVGIILSLTAFIFYMYPNESKVKDISAAAAQTALCPINNDISDIKSDLKELKQDVKEIYKKVR